MMHFQPMPTTGDVPHMSSQGDGAACGTLLPTLRAQPSPEVFG